MIIFLCIIASILNVLLLLLTSTLALTKEFSAEGSELILIMLMFVLPIVNIIALWAIYLKGKKETEPLKDFRERLEKIEASLQKDSFKPQ